MGFIKSKNQLVYYFCCTVVVPAVCFKRFSQFNRVVNMMQFLASSASHSQTGSNKIQRLFGISSIHFYSCWRRASSRNQTARLRVASQDLSVRVCFPRSVRKVQKRCRKANRKLVHFSTVVTEMFLKLSSFQQPIFGSFISLFLKSERRKPIFG